MLLARFSVLLFFIPIAFGCLNKKCDPISPSINSKHCIPFINAWLNEYTITSSDLYNPFFINDKTGWICGGNGTLLKTTDGGTTFANENTQTNQLLYKTQFINDQVGFVVGGNNSPNGIVLKSVNGGDSWQTTLNNVEAVRGVFFLNKDTGFVAGYSGSIRKTLDGGAHWSIVNTGTSSSFYDVEFVNESVGYACGNYGTIMKTMDGGQTWISLLNNMPQTVNNVYNALDFIDKNNGFVVGYDASSNNGFILKTTNGGASWAYINIYAAVFTDVVASDINNAFVGEGPAGGLGSIFKVKDNSITKDKLLPHRLNGLCFAGCTNAFASGESGFVIKAN